MLYCHLQHHNDTIIKDERRLLYQNICTSHFIARVRKGCVGFYCERELKTEQNWNILTPTLLAVNVVSFSFSWCSTRGPGVHSAGCWLSLLHLISIFSGPQTPSRFPRAPSAGCGFPYHAISNWNSNSTGLTSVLTELYNSSTPTWSLKSHVWSSSSGNNCHAVQRSLSSGASVYESIMGFFSLSHFVSQFPSTRFPLLTATRMCHFLPVHHLEWHFGPGRRSKHYTYT